MAELAKEEQAAENEEEQEIARKRRAAQQLAMTQGLIRDQVGSSLQYSRSFRLSAKLFPVRSNVWLDIPKHATKQPLIYTRHRRTDRTLPFIARNPDITNVNPSSSL